MTLTRSLFLAFFLLASFVVSSQSRVLASEPMLEGEPPAFNPHEPQTPEDKKRVAFAEEGAKKFLTNPLPLPQMMRHSLYDLNASKIRFEITPECLATPDCLEKNPAAKDFVTDVQHHLGTLVEVRFAHIIPQAFRKFRAQQLGAAQTKSDAPENAKHKRQFVAEMPSPDLATDEYIVHMYAKFTKGGWQHLDAVISEDAAGHLKLQRFYQIKISPPGRALPPGAKC
jgi:hypothetical protein